MKETAYIGHNSQLCCVEEVRLIGGKGDGMRLLQIRNASGLEFTVLADRCADISRLIFKGSNMGFFSVNGYVSPYYYDSKGTGFLKNFTAGFLTTCGLQNVGSPCVDDGEELPLHGTIGNTPCERLWWTEDDSKIQIHAEINDCTIFSKKLRMTRIISCGKYENQLTITDTVENVGDCPSPIMILYHFNIGYPLLSEEAIIQIPSKSIRPRDKQAALGMETWQIVHAPVPQYEEQCFFHNFEKHGTASIYNPAIGKGLSLHFDTDTLDAFTMWKMLGVKDYVLGLEPGNCYPENRRKLRENGELRFLHPGEKVKYQVKVTLFEKI